MFSTVGAFSVCRWNKAVTVLDGVLKQKNISTEILTFIDGFPEDVRNFMLLLYLTKKRNMSFASTVTAFIKKVDVNDTLEELVSRANTYTQPFICVLTSGDINQYIIIVNNKPITLSNRHFGSFIEVFDIYFKIFFVWNLKYDKSLYYFLQFFEVITYNIKNIKKCDFPPTISIWIRELVKNWKLIFKRLRTFTIDTRLLYLTKFSILKF